MTGYIARRLLLSIPALFGIIVIVFVLARVLPGDPCTQALGERASIEACAGYNVRYGLDQPIHEQFVALRRAAGDQETWAIRSATTDR